MITENEYREENEAAAKQAQTCEELATHYRQVLQLLGEDPTREGLQKTPMRVAKAMQVLTRGYEMDAHRVLTDQRLSGGCPRGVASGTVQGGLFTDGHRQGHRLLLTMRTPHAALLRKGTRGLYSQRLHHRAIENCTGCRHLQPSPSSTGTHDTADQGMHRTDTPPAGRHGRRRSTPHVHADAGD